MKKITIILAFVLLIILSGCAKKENLKSQQLQNLKSQQKQKCDPSAECCTDADCSKNSDNDRELSYYPPCYKGKCEDPKNSKEWIEYCDSDGSGEDYYHCYINAAYDALKKSSSLFGQKNYTIRWDDAFKICEKYIPDRSEECKLEVCDNLHFGDGGVKYDYPEEEQCKKEAIKNSSCFDKIRNGKESDVDCGGSGCGPCKIGDHCFLNSGCKTNACFLSFDDEDKCVDLSQIKNKINH